MVVAQKGQNKTKDKTKALETHQSCTTDSNKLSSEPFPKTDLGKLSVVDAITEPLFSLFQEVVQVGTTDLADPTWNNPSGNSPSVIRSGLPDQEASFWRYQQGRKTCAVVAQVSVYQALTGESISERKAARFANQQGWFSYKTGTPLRHVGKILNSLGIATDRHKNATIDDLIGALDRGDKPIVGLDGSEIWNPQRDFIGQPIEQPDQGHAVWVTGVDREVDGSIKIIINDSGDPYGKMKTVDYVDFQNAWSDYGFHITIADNPLT